jgi:hypothetical protein
MNDLTGYLRQLRRAGYVTEKTRRRNHWKISFGGEVVSITGSTPSNRFALDNLKSEIKRHQRQRDGHPEVDPIMEETVVTGVEVRSR